MKKYQTKPVVVEAVHFIATTVQEANEFIYDNRLPHFKITICNLDTPQLVITTLNGDMIASHGDYIIKDLQGEYYPCPPTIFNKKYTLFTEKNAVDIRDISFGKALEALKRGERITRKGWNGKNMSVFLETNITAGDNVPLLPCIVMRTVAGKYQPGWLASQADMLAEDWYVLPERNDLSETGSEK